MTESEARERIKKLRKEINRHRYFYHVLNRQEMSDAALDSLKHELVKIEEEFPELITADSPTQRVGGKPLPGFKKVRHQVPLLSLGDVFSEEELNEWRERARKRIALFRYRDDMDYFAEVKVDGFAVSLLYEEGFFKIGSTRGDGMTGEDVTANLKTIEAIPLSLQLPQEMEQEKKLKKLREGLPRACEIVKKIPHRLEVRGEVYMTKVAFDDINRRQKKKGLPLFANPRNIAAGSVRQLDPRIAQERKLEFFAYDVITDLGQKTHEESHAIARMLGFPTMELAVRCNSADDIMAFWARVLKKRDALPFLIDGIVVQINSIDIFKRLGVAGKAPRGAIAFKFPAEEATTKVRHIKVQVGRTGVLTPVAMLEPVAVGGVMVSRATLHNMDEIARLDVREGDTVVVKRAGDVIPAVIQVFKKLRPSGTRSFRMPHSFCGQPVIRPSGEVAYRIMHPKKCALATREQFAHFVSRGAFDIQGLGPKIIDHLCDEGLVEDAADFFALQENDLMRVEGFARKSAENLARAIAARKRVALHRFIFALGIAHVGEETALDLAKHFGILKKLETASREELERIPHIGDKVAGSVYAWFRDQANRIFLKKLARAGVRGAHEAALSRGGKFSGLSFVLTGGMETLTRDEAKARIREWGGDIAESVSKKTSFVVAGENPGTKLDRAKKWGVKIINEKELLNMMK